MEPGPALAVVGGLVLLAAVAGLLYLSRLSTLSRRVGSFACLLRHEQGTGPRWGARPSGDGGHRWAPGRAQYCTDRLVWWRTHSLAPRPARSWSRTDLVIVEREPVAERDQHGSPLLLVHCRHRHETFQLRMTGPACAGLVSWLESAPRVVRRAL
ncbi:MAG: hypothetical protein JWP95_910 [Actinotalea sp.]|nr:hypothetical protein [Actinotalea sp.]